MLQTIFTIIVQTVIMQLSKLKNDYVYMPYPKKYLEYWQSTKYLVVQAHK